MSRAKRSRPSARKSAGKRPAPDGSFCANCIGTAAPMFMELGWNEARVEVPICTNCSETAGGGTERVSDIIGRASSRGAA